MLCDAKVARRMGALARTTVERLATAFASSAAAATFNFDTSQTEQHDHPTEKQTGRYNHRWCRYFPQNEGASVVSMAHPRLISPTIKSQGFAALQGG
jgi:hypothetical protein